MANTFFNNYPYSTMNTIPAQGIQYGQMGFQPQPQMMQQRYSDGKTYVSGRAGADAYPMPNGVNQITLWDTDAHRFYIKGYDNNGMPRVLEDNDYAPHVQQEAQTVPSIDLSNYATKDDIKSMISDAFSSIAMPNMSALVTKLELDKVLSELVVGNGGRIVRNNESHG